MKPTILLMILLMSGCKSVKYIPVKTTETRTDYVDRFKTDSVHVRDSVFVIVKDDTVFKDRWRTVYKEVYARDTFYRQDTIREPYPVEVIKEKYRVPRSLWWLVILLAGLSVPSILKKEEAHFPDVIVPPIKSCCKTSSG